LDVINLVKLLVNRDVVLNRGEKILQDIDVFFTEYERTEDRPRMAVF